MELEYRWLVAIAVDNEPVLRVALVNDAVDGLITAVVPNLIVDFAVDATRLVEIADTIALLLLLLLTIAVTLNCEVPKRNGLDEAEGFELLLKSCK